MSEGMFRHLSPEEETEFRKWARENYKPFDPISGVWHPAVQAECVRMNQEAGDNFDAKAAVDALLADNPDFNPPDLRTEKEKRFNL